MTRPEDTLGWEGDEVDVAKLINAREKGFRLFVYTSPLDITQNVFYWQFPDGRKSVLFARLTDALENISVIDYVHCQFCGGLFLFEHYGKHLKGWHPAELLGGKPVPDHESAKELNEGL